MNEHFTTECIEKIDVGFIEEARTFPPHQPKSGYWKKLFFKYGIITVGMALLLIFTLLYPPRKYEIKKENGYYWLNIDPKYAQKVSDDIMIESLPNPNLIRRNSIQEMEQAFRHGSFTVQEFRILGSYATTDGMLRVFNLDNLIAPILPNGFAYYVEFTPEYYSFHASQGDTQVTVKFGDHNAHFGDESFFEKTVRIPADASNANSLRDEAYQTNYTDGDYNCYYIIVLNDYDYYVTELYRSEYSHTTPYKISIRTVPHDPAETYLLIDITHLAERPDVAWLAQFGFTEPGRD